MEQQHNKTEDVVSCLELLCSYYVSHALFFIARHKIPALIGNNECSYTSIAQKVGVDAESLVRVMRLLCRKGVFKETDPGIFKNSRISFVLSEQRSPHLHSLAELHRNFFSILWRDFDECIEKGESALSLRQDSDAFEMLKDDNSLHHLFAQTMSEMTKFDLPDLVTNIKFDKPDSSVLDVGGGNGALLRGLLEQYSDLNAAVLDRPETYKSFQSLQEQQPEKSPALSYIGGSFFEQVPAGYDYYILKNILHDWNDTEAEQILSNVSKAMTASEQESKLLVIEAILDHTTDNEPWFGRLRDLNMLVSMDNGRERTLDEMIALSDSAHLSIRSVRPLSSGTSILELALKA